MVILTSMRLTVAVEPFGGQLVVTSDKRIWFDHDEGTEELPCGAYIFSSAISSLFLN